VVISTNLSAWAAHAVARLPAGVPYALWLNLLDASTMAMLSDPKGPRWTFDLAPWAAKVYVIDKDLKTSESILPSLRYQLIVRPGQGA
jgi:hypothetical protein